MTAIFPWFRMYSEAVDDEKLRLIAFEDRWHFVALLCCKAKGILDDAGDMRRRKIAVKLGLDLRELDEVARRLSEVGLIEENTLQPIKWDDRQYRSDSSTERVRAYRERLKHNSKRSRNVTVTAQDTDTDTETEEKACAADATPSDPPAEQKKKASAISFDTFVNSRKAAGEKLISEDDPIFDWAESAGIPDDWLRLAWVEFSARYRGNAKRYADWPATFRNAVRCNWFKLWRIADGGNFTLTTEGEMGRRAAEAKTRKPAMGTAA